MAGDNRIELEGSFQPSVVDRKHYVTVQGDGQPEVKTTNSAVRAFLYLAQAYLFRSRGQESEIHFKITTKVKVFEGIIIQGKRKWQVAQTNQDTHGKRAEWILNNRAIHTLYEHQSTPYSEKETTQTIHAEDTQAKDLNIVSDPKAESVQAEGAKVAHSANEVEKRGRDEEVKSQTPEKWVDLDEWIKALTTNSGNLPEKGLGSLKLMEGGEESKKKVANLLTEIKNLSTFPFFSSIGETEKAKLKKELSKFNSKELEQLLVDVSKVGIPTSPNFHVKLQSVIIHGLSEIHPEIKEFVKETRAGDGYLQILTPKGIQTILNGLEGKIPKDYNVAVFDSFEDFAVKLEEIKQKDVSKEETSKSIFVVRHPESRHVTPFYLEKTSNGLRGVLLDSTGIESEHYFNLFTFIGKTVPEIQLYSYTEARQRDPSSCPIFAIHDVVQIANTPNFMNFVSQAAEEYNLDAYVPSWKGKGFFSDLPPSFMKPTQSLEMINDYLEKNTDRKEEKIGIQKKNTLSEAVERNTRTVLALKYGRIEERDQNKFAERKFEKYSTKLIMKVITDEENRREVKINNLLGAVKSFDKFPMISWTPKQRDEVIAQLNNFNPKEIEELLTTVSKIKDPKNSELPIQLRYEIVKSLTEIYPDINKYIALRNNLMVLSPESIEVAVKELKEKENIPKDTNVFVYGSFSEELKTKLRELKQVETPENEKYQCTFIVRHPGSNHVTPFHIEKDSNGIRAVILDSVGTHGVFADRIAKLIKNDASVEYKDIYVYTERRQRDESNCPIFAIQDTIQIAHTKGFMEFVSKKAKDYAEKSNPGAAGQEFNDLPPSFMKTTQSLTMIDDYLEKNVERKEEKIGLQQKRTLSQTIEKHGRKVVNREGEEKTINNFVERKFFNHLINIITKSIPPKES